MLAGCNEIRYQTARLRAASPPLEIPKVAELPDHRMTYDCKDGDSFDIYFPPGGNAAVLTLGGEDYALRQIATVAGKRFSDDRYELYMKEDGTSDLTLEEKKIRGGCKPR